MKYSYISRTLAVSLFSLMLASCGSSSSDKKETVTPDPGVSVPDPSTGGDNTSSGNDGGSTPTPVPTPTPTATPVIELNLDSLTVVGERTKAQLTGSVKVPENHTLMWETSSQLIADVGLSENLDAVWVETLDVQTGLSDIIEIKLTLSADGADTQETFVKVKVLDSLADPKETFELETEIGTKLLAITDRQIDNITSSEFYLDGLIVSDKEHAAHRTEVEFQDIAESQVSITNLPEGTWKIGKNKLYDYYVLKNQEDRVWVTEGNNFIAEREFKIKQQNDFLPSVIMWNIGDTTVFRFAYLHSNAYFINSLLRTYEVTSDTRYLELAQPTVAKTLNLLQNDVYYRRFMSETDFFYTGMDQGIILESVYEYAKYSQSPEYYQKAKDIATVFEHSTEGTWNHYTNSVIGGLIVEELKIPNRIDFAGLVNYRSALLVSEIDRLNGRIPYIMKTDDPRYLTFELPTYHTYDMMLIAKQGTYIDGRLNSFRIMDGMINMITANYGPYYANNVEALMYSYNVSGYTNLTFAQEQAGKLDIVTNTIQNHVSNMRAATAFLYMTERTDHPALNYNFKD